MSAPKVSVLVPVYNGELTITRCVDAVLAQDYPDYELIVVDDASTDRTAECLEPYRGRATILRNEVNSGISRTYNRALAASRGEVVVMVASDCVLRSPSYLTRLVHRFEDPKVGAVAGKPMIADFEHAPSLHRIFARLNILDVNDSDAGVHEVNFVELRCDGFSRAVLERMGGLNEDLFRSNEDQDVSIRITRLGYRLLQDNTLEFELGFGGTEDTLAKLLSKQAQYARGQAYIAVNYGVGSRDGLWTNDNRRRRALHRMSQAAFLPVVAVLGIGAAVWTPAVWTLPALLLQRLWHYRRLASDLRPAERTAALPLGIACDTIYSFAFLSGSIAWIASGKSRLVRGRSVAAGPPA